MFGLIKNKKQQPGIDDQIEKLEVSENKFSKINNAPKPDPVLLDQQKKKSDYKKEIKELLDQSKNIKAELKTGVKNRPLDHKLVDHNHHTIPRLNK